MPKTVLVFALHPADAEYYAGGTLAKWIAAGVSSWRADWATDHAVRGMTW
jgi:LmbE family N-acetylglucosaminyl deacetylase